MFDSIPPFPEPGNLEGDHSVLSGVVSDTIARDEVENHFVYPHFEARMVFS
jgi:hypothetical protein